MTDLQSSIKKQGKIVTQIIHIKSEYIKQGQFTKLITQDGRMILINDKNVLCIEVFPES